MKALLFTLPGTPVLYYGDEIGMGDNIYLGDRNGVRTPFQWSPDRNAGFSKATPQKLYLPVIIDPEYHFEAYNVEAQQNNPSSFLWFMKRLIALRKRYPAASRGAMQVLYPANHKVFAFIRSYDEQRLLIVANLSRFPQSADLDLSQFLGMTPVEAFGQNKFPEISDALYRMTLGPHSFYFFSLEKQERALSEKNEELPALEVAASWEEIFQKERLSELARTLLAYIQSRRWFGGKARRVQRAVISSILPFSAKSGNAYIAFVQLEYTEGEPEIYALPLKFEAGGKAEQLLQNSRQAAIAWIRMRARADIRADGVLIDALWDQDFAAALLHSVQRKRRVQGGESEITSFSTSALRNMNLHQDAALEPSVLQLDQSNTSVVYGKKIIMKFFRKLERGANPELEIGQYLSKQNFPNAPQLLGAIEYRSARQEPATIAILHRYILNEGNAWQYTLDAITRFYELALTQSPDQITEVDIHQPLLKLAAQELPEKIIQMAGPYLESARLLGRRTAELHLALAKSKDDPALKPERFSDLYRRSLYHSITGQANHKMQLLREQMKSLPQDGQTAAAKVLDQETRIRQLTRLILDQNNDSLRIRCHGDFHLGQILYTGKDFVIIDFEGEPARLLGQRRIKHTPLRDVAGMLRSFHYASYAPLLGESGNLRTEDIAMLGDWAQFWCAVVSATFLKSYFDLTASASFFPKSQEQIQALLDISMLDKVLYELGYELNNRPHWAKIPMEGILQLLG
jgi:maltose alpha-D-glucosyltransferase/alpha-amylase